MSLSTTTLVIKPVQTSREKTQFLNLPWEIYKGNDYWIPPLQQNQKELSHCVKHPFFKDNEKKKKEIREKVK